MTREQLEDKAKDVVCASDFWDLAGDIDLCDDDTLKAVIANPHYIHESQGFNCEYEENSACCEAPITESGFCTGCKEHAA